jgi:hypothetical protein
MECFSGLLDKNDPENIVKEYFSFWESRNKAGLESITTQVHKGTTWDLDNLESLTLDSIWDCTSKHKNEYLESGRGSLTKPYDVKVYCTKFRVTVKQERALNNGEYDWMFILIKQNRNSNWIIDDWGY